MAIQFNEIPFNWLRKSNLAEIRPNYQQRGPLPWPTKVLVVGQMLTGLAAAGVPQPITRTDQAAALFGAGSMLDMMIKAFRANNTTSELWAVGLADAGSSVAATRTLTITGSPQSAGTWPLWLAGRSVRVGASLTDTPTSAATAIAAAVNADTTLPFTASSALGVVTLTARNKGTWGNGLDVRVGYYPDDQVPPGFTAAVAAGTAGATDPTTIGALLTTIANTWFTDIVWPYTDSTNMALLETELARRYNALNALDMHAYTCTTGSYSTVTTWSSTRNSQWCSTLAINAPLDPAACIAAALAADAAFSLGNDPSRQLGSLVLRGIKAPADSALYTDTEQNLMLGKGLSTFDVLPDGTVTLNRVVTNYQKTSLGVADQAWLDIMVPKTMSRLRYDWVNYKSLIWPRAKLAADNSPALNQLDPNAGIVTPLSAKATYMARYRVWAQQGWVQDAEYAKANSYFEIDAADKNKLNGRLSLSLMGNLIVGADVLEFAA